MEKRRIPTDVEREIADNFNPRQGAMYLAAVGAYDDGIHADDAAEAEAALEMLRRTSSPMRAFGRFRAVKADSQDS